MAHGGDMDAADSVGAKVLGGSSALNFLVWDRASTVEYDAWEALGNKGWSGLTDLGNIMAIYDLYVELEIHGFLHEKG